MKLNYQDSLEYLIITFGRIKKVSNKKEKWDGRSRVSNDVYRKRFDEIFGQKESDELKESYEQSLKNKKERDDKKK